MSKSMAHLLNKPVGVHSASDWDDYVLAINGSDWDALKNRFWVHNVFFSLPGQESLSSADVLAATLQKFRQSWDRQIQKTRWLAYEPGGRSVCSELEVDLYRMEKIPGSTQLKRVFERKDVIWSHIELDEEGRMTKIRMIPEPERTILPAGLISHPPGFPNISTKSPN